MRVGQRKKRYFESVVHVRTDARFVALADDCRVEKLSCTLEIISPLSRCFMSTGPLTAEQLGTKTTLAHIDTKTHQ